MDLKIFTIIVMGLILVPIVNAQISNSTCVDENTLETSVYLIKYKDGVRTNYTFVDRQVCPSGCSYTLNGCRFDSYNETLYVSAILGGVLSLCGLAIFLSYKTETGFYVVILMIVSIMTFIVATTDVFSSIYRTIFLVLTFVPASLIIFAYLKRPKKR